MDKCLGGRVRVMVFMSPFSIVLHISWRSVLYVEEAGIPGESHRPAASHSQTKYSCI